MCRLDSSVYRIRKVKCDEDRPACRRCIATGRVCDGYGIWGGGGNTYAQRAVATKRCSDMVECKLPVPISRTKVSTDEYALLDWFMRRTVRKLPGVFSSAFWDTLLYQASATEPAVLHAILALSSAHRKEGIDSKDLEKKKNTVDELERSTLQQYSNAISHLQPHFSDVNKASVRVALITCLVFIYMEFLRGNYKTANSHLQTGLKLLEETQIPSRTSTFNDLLILKPSQDSADDCIVETFIRLQVQAVLFGQLSLHFYLTPDTPEHEMSRLAFRSVNDSRQHLDRLLSAIFHFTEQCRQQVPPEDSIFREKQQRIKAGLATWLSIYQSSQGVPGGKNMMGDPMAYQLLHIYFTMATIMADTCLEPSNQSIFDSQIQSFISIIIQSIDLSQITNSSGFELKFKAGDGLQMSKSIAELGWIPPLYYTAIKCRDHRVRIQAIRLLEMKPHKEGIWDGGLAASIAREVVRIEEGDFYRGFDLHDDFPPNSIPVKDSLLLPVLPVSQRFHEVQVVLPDVNMGNVTLICKGRLRDGFYEDLVSEYDIVSQSWVGRTTRE